MKNFNGKRRVMF